MRVGLSLSRCVRDIVEGRVNINDVLVLIARTDFDPTNDEQWNDIWLGYTEFNLSSLPEWQGLDHDTVKEVVLTLYLDGRIHQPRKFGVRPRRSQYYWLEVVLPSEELYTNTAARRAFEEFQTIAGLAGVDLDSKF